MTEEFETIEVVEEETYSDTDRLFDIATWAERLSLPVLIALLIATLGQTGIQLYAILSSGSTGASLSLNLGYTLLNTLRDLGLAAAAYILLRAAAQGLFMLLDLQEK